MLSSLVLKVCHVRTHLPTSFLLYKTIFLCSFFFFNSLFYILTQHHTNTGIYMDFFFPLAVSFFLPFILTHFYYSFFFVFFLYLICFYLYSSSCTKPLLSSSALHHHHTITSNICFALITYQPTRLQPPTTTKFKFFLFF